MKEFFFALISIVAFTGLIRAVRDKTPIRLCGVCAGTSLTWLGITALILQGALQYQDYGSVLPLLMGGSVVGIAYQGEFRFEWAFRHPFAWKFFVIVLGFTSSYYAVTHLSWGIFAAEVFVLFLMAYLFFIRKPPKNDQSRTYESYLETKLKNCC